VRWPPACGESSPGAEEGSEVELPVTNSPNSPSVQQTLWSSGPFDEGARLGTAGALSAEGSAEQPVGPSHWPYVRREQAL
jgi:hypothetical protein